MNDDKLDMQSPNWVNKNTQFIAEYFPNCVTETAEGIKVDFDLLKQELSADLIEGNKERYRLEWPGKREAIVTANLPTTKTLRPIREDSVNFDTTENVYIEGDNLEVLKLLQENYLGKIKMIYIDPPYNTGKDFVYKDNFKQDGEEYKEESGEKDEYNQRLVVNPDSAGRYHSNWLSMMYPRLKLARNLLKDDGVIFLSIGDVEIDNLKKVANEIYGEVNFVTCISRVMKKGGQKGVHFSPCIDYILVYAKNVLSLNKFREAISQNLIDKVYTKVVNEGERKGEKYRTQGLYQAMLDKRPNQRFFIKCPDGTLAIPPGNTFPKLKKEGEQVTPNDEDGVWRWTYSTFDKERNNGNVEFIQSPNSSLVTDEGKPSKWNIYKRIWLKDRLIDGQLPGNILERFESRHSSTELKLLDIPFDFPKPKNLIKYLMSIVDVKANDIVLDYFSGSGTTGHSLMEYTIDSNSDCNFICIQIPESTGKDSAEFKLGFKNICEIGKERIRRAGKAIIKEQQTKIKDLESKVFKVAEKITTLQEGKLKIEDPKLKLLQEEKEGYQAEIIKLQQGIENLDIGFRVYRLDESNMKDVYYKPQEYTKTLLDKLEDNVKAGRTADDLLAQVMLDWGLPLSLPIEQATIAGKEVFKVAGNSLYACFDTGIDEAFAKAIAKEAPLRIVFKDVGFKDDTAKENVKQLLKQLSPSTEMKVL